MSPMSRDDDLVLEGGPHDGMRARTAAGSTLRMPVRRPANVLTMVHGAQLTMDIAEYHRVGNVYRWDRLVEDAFADMRVAAEWFVVPEARRAVRSMLRRSLEDLAGDKEVDRIVWRVSLDSTMTYRIRALVGGRRVERGLAERESRR